MARYKSPFTEAQTPGGVLWVNAYRFGQTYGGPEEGGWYKSVYEIICSVPVPAKRVPKDHDFTPDQHCRECGKPFENADHKWNVEKGTPATKPEHYPKCSFDPRYNCEVCGLDEDEDGVQRGVNENEHYDLEAMEIDSIPEGSLIPGAPFAKLGFNADQIVAHLKWLFDDVNEGDPNSVLDGSRLVVRLETAPGKSYVYPTHYE